MYEVTVTANISASHHLRGYQGKCENVHGHNYRVQATVRTEKLNEIGLALDFGDLRKELKSIAEHFDHHDLNQTPEFSEINPSSENISRVIFDLMAQKIDRPGLSVYQVRVWETEGSFVTYRKSD
jgi:6-pyruvoyltetrahydropterin/6-carboxytetrahydropterin synthase